MTFSPRAIEAAARAAALADLDEETREIIDLDKHMLLVCAHYEEIAVAALSAALAVDGVALVPVDALSVVLDAAEMYCDEGPFDEGWRSQKLIDACEMVAKSVYAAASDGDKIQ